ncbi:MAG: methyltransferase domain-containing protein [Candidatus Promineifilaceae bacterium]
MTTNQALRWYNGLSLVHDLLSFNDWPYRDARKQAINTLDLQPGDTVIDLFCGTGVNFEPVLAHIEEQGQLIGIDGSTGMLAQARQRIQKASWNPEQIQLLEQDMLQMAPHFLDTILPPNTIPKVLITLALGVFPNYETVFTNIFNAMPSGTRFALLEGYCEEGARGAWLLNFIGHSDCRRPVWEPVQELTHDYQETWYPAKFKYIQGSLIVATGVKR